MVLRHILRSWLQNAARRKVREKVVEAARHQVANAVDQCQADESGATLRTCDVGVVFALRIEAGGLEDLLTEVVSIRGHGFVVRQGKLKGRHVALILSGAGAEAAARATEALIAGHSPKWVLSAGFAGGLKPQLKRHDVLMADSLADGSGARLAIDLKVDPAALARTPGVHVGRLLSADRVVRLPREKEALGLQNEALAVDLESFAVAEVCRRRQVRFLAVRVIGDPVDEQLPPDVEHLLEQKTSAARLGAAVGAVWKRPSSFKDMFRLKENALEAANHLAKFLAATIEQL